jgi:hypothetical protein
MSDPRAIVFDMDDSRILRGIELRYALTEFLGQHGTCNISTLIDGLTYQGFVIAGNPAKAVSDALRWEMGHCRVLRRGPGAALAATSAGASTRRSTCRGQLSIESING